MSTKTRLEKPPELSQSQKDLGSMPNAIWTSGKIRGGGFKVRATLDEDSLWKYPYPARGKHLVYANTWGSDSTVGQRASSSRKPSLIAPDPSDYTVNLAYSPSRETWGASALNSYGFKAEMFIESKTRGNQTSGYWSKLSPRQDDIWFKDGNRLCKPDSRGTLIGNCGVGDRKISLGYGSQGGVMENILWIDSVNLVMLPQNQILDISSGSNFVQLKLPTTMYGVTGQWAPGNVYIPPVTEAERKDAARQFSDTATGVQIMSINRATKSAVTYKDASNVSRTVTGWGLGNALTVGIAPSTFRLAHRVGLDQLIIQENGNIFINKKAAGYSIAVTPLRRTILAGYVPLKLVFEVDSNTFHRFTLWLKL